MQVDLWENKLRIIKVVENKKDYLDLLLLGDEQESMIDRYLEAGKLYALYDGNLKTVCVVKEVDCNTLEIKNLATYEEFQGRGYATKMLDYIFEYYREKFKKIIIGTGDASLALSFYKKYGFQETYVVKNFFIDHYDHDIIENGCKLKDMPYLEKEI